MVKKPSEELNDLLAGRQTLEETEPAVRSWARLYIYWAAEEVLEQPTRAARNQALEKVPANIRDAVRQEAVRIWELRKGVDAHLKRG